MSKVLIMSFTNKGVELSNLISKSIETEYDVREYAFHKYIGESNSIPFTSGKDTMRTAFVEKYDYVIFIGAVAMAVRMLDGLMQGKDKDPAVIVVDVMANFAISVLSGHIGGGNEFTKYIADIVGATPVITTATDVSGHFAPDVFAKKNNLKLLSLSKAKEVAAAILNGETVKAYVEPGVKTDKLPDEIEIVEDESELDDKELSVRILKETPFDKANALYLIKRDIIIGVGCRKNIESEVFEREISDRLKDNKIDINRVLKIHSIDIKQDEKAINDFCEKYDIESEFFSESSLNRIEGEFTKSEFVRSVTGVDNVCERSAIAKGDELFVKKTAKNGVTMALARRKM